jgi:phosphoadenosine phosphosulfate reductase
MTPNDDLNTTPVRTISELHHAIATEFPGEIALVSSFGAEASLLLALVAEVNPHLPVLFIDTGKHFAETLAYRDALVRRLGLTDVRSLRPLPADLARRDQDGELHRIDPDACCNLRKVLPLKQALPPFRAWINGRKRFQSAERAEIPVRETIDGKVKLNPLAAWTAEAIALETTRRALPPHPLVAQGYGSIGCAPCTSPVRTGDDPRAGRWAGTAKTECGIHRSRHRPATAPAIRMITTAERDRPLTLGTPSLETCCGD